MEGAAQGIGGETVIAQPYFTIFTTCYKRPIALARHKAVLATQTDRDYEHILIVDDVGRGFGWVAEQFEKTAPQAQGRYVLNLADDDELTGPDALVEVREAIGLLEHDPEVIVCQFGFIWSNGRQVTIPEPEYWHGPAVKGHISGQNLIVRNDIYQKHRHDWRYEGDGYEFEIAHIQAILDPINGYRVLWLPMTVSRMQYRGLGRTEEELAARLQPHGGTESDARFSAPKGQPLAAR